MATTTSWVTRILQPALSRLANATAPTGEAILHGLEHDLGRVPTLDQGWQRLCAAAWGLGFSSLQLEPMPGFAEAIPTRLVNGPAPEPRRNGLALSCALSFRLNALGRHVATLHASLGLSMLDFDPARFAAAAQSLLARFVRVAQTAADAGPEPDATPEPAGEPDDPSRT